MLSERTIKALDGIRKCSIDGKWKVRDLFEIIVKHPDLWMQAYANIYANKGAVTKGIDQTTQDGFSDERVNNLIKLLREGRYFPTPSKRIFIPKANGKLRPLSIPSGDDKLVQEVARIILEAIYEPVFSENSHGFRPKRSCHTALEQINTWTGTVWLIEFDIRGFYDNIDHTIMVQILEKKIDDVKFIQIIRRMLRAGYMENWKFHRTYSGVPQGSIVSPILANIYLNELDNFILDLKYDKGKKRAYNPEYRSIVKQKEKLRKQLKGIPNEKMNPSSIQILQRELNELEGKQRSIPSGILDDRNFKRLRYCRYADDFLIGIIGPKEDAQLIKGQVANFLKNNLKLDLSADKTGIKHAKSEGAIFLGYKANTTSFEKILKVKIRGSYVTKRTSNSTLILSVPEEKIQKFCENKGYGQWKTISVIHRSELLELSDVEILSTYNAELRGLANYYVMANNVKTELNKLFYMARYSLVKTLASKHKTQVSKTLSKFRLNGDIAVRYENKGEIKYLKLFKLSDLKSIPQRHQKIDEQPNTFTYSSMNELLRRWYAQECEICGKSQGYFEVHHIRMLKDINDGKQKWQKRMIARKRKTMILCVECHDLLHAGKLPDWRFMGNKMESRVH
jgi:group II intron reverse transcriptase/maturase